MSVDFDSGNKNGFAPFEHLSVPGSVQVRGTVAVSVKKLPSFVAPLLLTVPRSISLSGTITVNSTRFVSPLLVLVSGGCLVYLNCC